MAISRVTPAEFEWREWRLGEGRYKDAGYPQGKPKRKSIYGRPTALERPLWFARLKLFLAKRRPKPPPSPLSLGLLGKPFAFYRNPRGGVENIQAAKDAGLRVLLLNVQDFVPSEWAKLLAKAEALGLTVGYWAHCTTVSEVDELLAHSVRHSRPLVCINVEQELASTVPPRAIADSVKRSGYPGEVSTILLGWVQNGVDLRPIGDWPILLELFPQDAAALWPPTERGMQCLEHANIQGAKLPVLVYGTYDMSEQQAAKIRSLGYPLVTAGDAQPGWYPMNMHHGLYTVDDTGERWVVWGW